MILFTQGGRFPLTSDPKRGTLSRMKIQEQEGRFLAATEDGCVSSAEVFMKTENNPMRNKIWIHSVELK